MCLKKRNYDKENDGLISQNCKIRKIKFSNLDFLNQKQD